ncbi:DsbA family protein [Vibrio gallicus]|uniref:DsbA family protein n=1 Tax=Vibrio gallicus TaxID=190897 RepID=UPI0021C43D32|nr:DsbA family protein [Vibrio gallicus]
MGKATLYYVYDPMCAWCWGYRPTWEIITSKLDPKVEVKYLVGGLAPDSAQPMPLEMRGQIQSYWQRIQSQLGTQFNYDFWTQNTPRRSTYPACRACLIARQFGLELQMYAAIQRAYYLQARNPSDDDVLGTLAEEIGLDRTRFLSQLHSKELQQELTTEIAWCRSIGGNSFPSLFLKAGSTLTPLQIEYQDPDKTLNQINALIAQ